MMTFRTTCPRRPRRLPPSSYVALTVLLQVLTPLALPTSLLAQESPVALEQLTRPRFSYPTWSPDGSRVLYESAVSGNWEIYVMDLDGIGNDGGNVVQLTDNDSLDRMPSWSPDGEWIAFVSDRDGDYEVFRMRPDGSEQLQLTRNGVAEIHPYWTPDGERLLYNSRVADERLYAIWIMNGDGSAQREVLRDEELNSYAQLSPDGRSIVFDKWQDNDENNGEIYVFDLEDERLTRLTSNDVYDGYPTWTPDGRAIVYASQVGGSFKLFRMRPDGTDRQQLTFGPGNDQRPDVSPDGTRILFNREIDDSINIYTIPAAPVAAASQAASEEAELIALAEHALELISDEDMIGLTDLMAENASIYSVIDESDGEVLLRYRSRAEERASEPSSDLLERGFAPRALVADRIGVVWLPYDFYTDGEWSHCGVDAFTMLRDVEGWKIVSIAYTVAQAPDCEPHPDGPPER